MTEPVFEMPVCHRHFFSHHRWWCRACDRETESQFREVCEALWALRSESSRAMTEADIPHHPENECEECNDAGELPLHGRYSLGCER